MLFFHHFLGVENGFLDRTSFFDISAIEVLFNVCFCYINFTLGDDFVGNGAFVGDLLLGDIVFNQRRIHTDEFFAWFDNGACLDDPENRASTLHHALDFFVVGTFQHSIFGNRDAQITASDAVGHDRLVIAITITWLQKWDRSRCDCDNGCDT